MAGNSFGTLFTVTSFGESHGPALGCVIDGCPAGIPLDAEIIAAELRRRRPGGGGPATARAEADEPAILSGVFEGKTLGTPIAILIRNSQARSSDYDTLRDRYRPGHADWVWEAKYGIRDHRGGGRASGRESAGRVAAGAVARAFLALYGISVRAWTSQAGGIDAPGPGEAGFSLDEIEGNPLRMPSAETAARVMQKIEEVRRAGDSLGGIVSCRVTGAPPGLGEPVFDKLDARLAAAMLSIGAAKGIEFGSGFAAAGMGGLEHNDRPLPVPAPAQPTADRHFKGLPPGVPPMEFETNHAGGILGGISTGSDMEFRVAFKPVPSVSAEQTSLNREGRPERITVGGRHDLCVCPRAVPVVEAMAALVLADFLLLAGTNRLRVF